MTNEPGGKSKSSIRKARYSDRDNVLNVCNSYDGMDYLSDYYDFFIGHNNMVSYVYEEDGEIVAFTAASIIDGGESAADRASRVRPDRQNEGVYKKLLAAVDEDMKRLKTVSNRVCLTSPPMPSSFLNIYNIVAKRKRYFFEFDMDLSTISKMNESNRRSLDLLGNELPSKFFTDEFSLYLFPEGRIIVDKVPYRVMQSNGGILKGKSTTMVSDVEITSNGNVGLLTASSLIRATAGCGVDTICVLDIFGSDFRNVKDHIVFHLLRNACQGNSSMRDIIELEIIITAGTEYAMIVEALREFGIERLTSGPRVEKYSDMVAYERILNK